MNGSIMTMKMKQIMMTVLALTLLAGAMAIGGDRSKQEIIQSMKQRYPKLMEAKDAGSIGEQYDGYVGAVTRSASEEEAVKALIAGENDDRKALYAIIAEETGATVAQVAARNRARLYEKAKSGHWLQTSRGKWVKKK